MTNALYDFGRNAFARGEIAWRATGGSTIRCMLVDAAAYTPNLATHDYFDDVPASARVGNNGSSDRTQMPQITLIDPVAGVCDGEDVTFTSVPAGNVLEYLIIFRDSGADNTSELIAFIDTATGLPITPNGADINVSWDNGANRIFKL